LYGLISGLVILGAIAFLLYRNNRQKQKANLSLLEQKDKVENTLQELKLTQRQLIQSEKMASLGELTAGIAHEIQNPLNFVNNFSEVNTELIDELEQEVNKGNLAEIKAIAKDIKDNEQKINHHGKRADAIVKGMLQHSRSTGQKELTDINALADEYLRLAYHGLRAKDETFNATLETNLDSSLPQISVVPQDIGRVILNVINNAFYAVSEKSTQNIAGYEPNVVVSTQSSLSPGRGMSAGQGEGIRITVQDNGNGIPESIKDKIFQPFFTTKPTGQGTGLGLSLAYDIIKAHSGEIKIDTSTGEGTVFIITLPLNPAVR
jgi:signal transduction histidine kinase